ncbi:MAG: hypothetical protein AB4372_40280, partial [Xenococcus sp. (in: cyanobacteria)]
MNTNTIPLAFSPLTEAHDQIINYFLPPVAQKMYSWFTRRARPGTIQEFDKEDFDEYWRDIGRKPVSKQWFMTCMKMLYKTRLVKLVRKYQGYGFKIIAYHPWQVDDWVIDDDRQKVNNPPKGANSNNSDRSKNPKKNQSDLHKKFKILTRNSDSAVALDRENRVKEKGNTKAPNSSDRRIPKPILKKTAFAAAPPKTTQKPLNLVKEEMRADGKEDITSTQTTDLKETATTGKKRTTPIDEINDTKKTAVSNSLKGGEHINCRPTPSTSLKNDLKVKSENVNQVNGDNKNHGDVDVKVNKKESKTKPPKVDVKINNKEWRSHLEEVDQLGIKGNKTIVNALKTFSTERVKAAIALYRQRKIENGYIENPCGYFMQALKED